MNNCILMAEIIKDPQLRFTQDNNLAVAEMTVQFPGFRDDEPPTMMRVIGWGNFAQEMQEKYHVGDRVIIEGRLGMVTFDRPEGFKEKRAELTAQRIHLLGEGASLTTTAVAPATTAATNTPNPQFTAHSSSSSSSTAPAKATRTPVKAGARATVPPTPAEDPVDYDDIPF